MSTEHNPFQSPSAAPQFGGGAWWDVPYSSGHPRAMITIALLVVSTIIAVIGAIYSAIQYAAIQNQGFAKFAAAHAHPDASTFALLGASEIVWIGTVIAFCMWTHRAARNLPALGGRNLKYTPGWAVGWFFIPFANFVVPYFVGMEIWRHSDPQQSTDGYGSNSSPVIAGWWLTYVLHWILPFMVGAVVGGIAGFAAARHGGDPHSVAATIQHQTLPGTLLAGVVKGWLEAFAGVLAIVYVRRVDSDQEAKFDRISGRGFAA